MLHVTQAAGQSINLVENLWLEMTTLPFLAVMTFALGFRFRVTAKVNRRFFELILATLAAAVIEISSEIKPENLFIKHVYNMAMGIDAWCLMRYVGAYTLVNNRKFYIANNIILGLAMFFPLFLHFYNPLFCGVVNATASIIFMLEGFVLQVVFQRYYSSEEFLLMNLSFIVLIDAFILQYIFDLHVQIIYTCVTVYMFFTFFYLEAPAYRRIIDAQRETKEARANIERSIARTEKSSRAKSDFLASTSHEVRTPMNAILGMNEMILNETDDPETRKYAVSIRNASNHLLNIINNILDISKIESGKMEIYNEDYHFGNLIRECENYIFNILRDKPIKFISDVDPDMPEHLHGDNVRLKQVLINLLDNAAKYTRTGKITLKISSESVVHHKYDVILKIAVQDTGIGIRKEELPLLFEPFSRVNLQENRHILGAGLGLTLIKNVVHLMKGKIDVDSVFGEGTTFKIEIPQKKAVSGEDLTIAEYDSRFLEFEEDVIAGDVGDFKCPGARILVVDETQVNLTVARGMLKNSEATIDTAESGEDALNLMKWHKYDIVFLDHLMPGIDGIETLNRAKQIHPDTIFIALTANSGSNARAMYLGYGFNDYLPKPFEQKQINALLRKFIRE